MFYLAFFLIILLSISLVVIASTSGATTSNSTTSGDNTPKDDTACEDGKYGEDCSEECTGCKAGCVKETGICDVCEDGKYDKANGCKTSCPSQNCKVADKCSDNGQCTTGCKTKFWGSYSDTDKTYACDKPCSNGCKDQLCDEKTGACKTQQCEPKWKKLPKCETKTTTQMSMLDNLTQQVDDEADLFTTNGIKGKTGSSKKVPTKGKKSTREVSIAASTSLMQKAGL